MRTPIGLLLGLLLTGCGGAPARLTLPPASPRLSTAQPSLRVADAALAGGAPAMALQVADGILARQPNDAAALLRQGDALYALQRGAEAADSYMHALAVAPHSAPALIGLARVRLGRDPAAAETLLQQALALDRRNPTALNDLGIARDLQGHHAAAQQAYQAALAEAPAMTAAEVNLGLSLALSGDPTRALQVLRPLAASPDTSSRIRQDLAAALALAGDSAAAEALLARDLSPAQVAEALSGYQQLRRSAAGTD